MANTFIFDDDEQPDMGSPAPEQDDDQSPEEGEGNNRTFILLLIGIGAFTLVVVLCIVGYLILSNTGVLGGTVDTEATNVAVTQQAIFAQETQNSLASPTLPPTEIFTVTPTVTSVVVFATETPGDLVPVAPETATVEAMQTQLAGTILTSTAEAQATIQARATVRGTPTRTATARIPQTGFADEVGLPALVVVTIILLGVILLARRLRGSPAR